MARPLLQLLIPGVAVLLAACGGAAPASAPASPSVTSAVAKPASASAAASLAAASASTAVKPSASAAEAAKPSAPASVALTGPAAVAMRFLDVVARGDTVGVPALFTDDAVVLGAPPCSVTAFCKGPAAIAKFVEAAAAVHQKPTLIGTPQVAGNLIFLRYEVRNDTVSKAGVERYIILANTIVFGDKLDAYAAQNDLSDAQTVKYQTYIQQQAQASASAAAPPAAKTDPAALAQRYYDALNRGDANAAVAVFADKAVNITGNCALRAPCTTTADILKGIQTVIAGHIKVTQGDPLVAGNLVQFHSENRSDAAAEAGVGSFRAFETWTLAGDKAVGRINLFDLSDAQTVKYQLYVQQQAEASASAAAKPAASAAASAKPAG